MTTLKNITFNLPDGEVITAGLDPTVTAESFLKELQAKGRLEKNDSYEIQSLKGFRLESTKKFGFVNESEFNIINISQIQRIMNAKNSKQWSSATPGFIIFLIDQSGSMGLDYSGGRNRAEFTALVINRTINDLILTNSAGDRIKNRVFISLIGYGGEGGNSVTDIRSSYLSDFADNPLRIEKLRKKVSDGAGGLVEIEEEMPIFVDPVINGLTPIGEALAFAKGLIENWIIKYPDNPAPVLINISDGMPYEGVIGNDEPAKTLKNAQELMNVSTIDGNPLIFNVHIGDGVKEYGFEENESLLPDEQAKLLFNISSKVPESYKEAANKHGFHLSKESRGFVSNAGPETLIKFINFGSSGGTDLII